MDEVLAVAIEEIKNYFSIQSFFILQDGNNILYSTGRLQKDKKLSHDDYSIAEWTFIHSAPAGSKTEISPSSEYTFYPLPGTKIKPGVVAVRLEHLFAGDQKSFWDTFLAQISNALEREFLGELAQKARFLDESDKLYKTLFNSISHEFRIPVAAIMGASETLISSSHSQNVQLALYNEIFIASIRLNRLIENLLNMSRLESGHLSVRLDWYELNDLINKVSEDLKEELKPFTLKVYVPENIPLVKIDFGLMEQVIHNILLNSSQYAPSGSDIEIKARYARRNLVIEIMDRGPGFTEEALKNAFNKFFKLKESKAGGLGIGLSIVKGFVDAHNGSIKLENRKGGGARFSIKIPSENPEIKNINPGTDESE